MYDYFGDIVCINLMSRPDRKRNAVAVFGELGIPVRFFPAEIDPQGGMNKMLSQDWSNYIGHMHVDVFYANHAGLVNYCIVPMVFNQKMCLESNIEATNVIERIMRSVQCVAVDKLQVMYVLSLIKYVVFEMCCSVVFITVLITIYWLFKSSKSASLKSANKTYRQRKL